MKKITLFSLAIAFFSFTNSKMVVKHENNYAFTKKISYKITDKKDQTTDITYYFGDNGSILMEFGDVKTRSIMDVTNEVMITLDDERKTAMVVSTSFANKMMAKKVASHNDNVTITKTGETKQILGYHSEKYLVADKKTSSEVWLSKQVDFNNKAFVQSLSQRTGIDMNNENMSDYGFLMESIQYDKKGRLETVMTLTEYNDVQVSVNLSNYEVTVISLGM